MGKVYKMKKCNIGKESNWTPVKLEGNGPWEKEGYYIHWCRTHNQFNNMCAYGHLVEICDLLREYLLTSDPRKEKLKNALEDWFGHLDDDFRFR